MGLAISSLTGRRAFAVGGYLAFLTISTVMGGVLAHALNARYFRLLAVAAAPIQAARGLFPGYTDRGHISPAVWALDRGRGVCAGGHRAGGPLRAGRGVSAPAIEFTGVSRWYGDTVSLADVSFTADGGVIGLLGHNGAGKSTTLKLCGRVLDAEQRARCASSVTTRGARRPCFAGSGSCPTTARRGRS